MTEVETYYTGIFLLICWAIFIIVWAIAAFGTKRTIERDSWWWRLILVAIVAGVFLLRRSGLFSFLTGAALWQQTLLPDILGAAVTLVGLIGALWARASLGGNWSSDVVIKENHELIERGPYHWVRHPIYSSMLLMAIGGAIWYGRAMGFVTLILVLFALWYKSQQEERLLTKHFPEEYPSYKARVKALIPFVL